MFSANNGPRPKLLADLEARLGPAHSQVELGQGAAEVLRRIEKAVSNEKSAIESAPPAVFMPWEWQASNGRIQLHRDRIAELRGMQKASSHKIESTLESASRAYLIPMKDVCTSSSDIDDDEPSRPDRSELEGWVKSKGVSARYVPLMRDAKFKGELKYRDFNWEELGDEDIILYVEENTLTQQRKLEAIDTLRKNIPYLAPLRAAFGGLDDGAKLEDASAEHPQVEWRFLTDATRAGCNQQRDFVEKALATPDFAFLWGPPGSGKTTAICELVAQLAAKGKKILLCASTHVAVDNVIEKLEEFSLCARPDSEASLGVDVIPLRIATDPSNVSEAVQPYIEATFVEGEKERIKGSLRRHSKYRAAKRLLQALDDEGDSLAARLARDSANLICGTTMGFMQYEDLRDRGISITPAFDYVILDECSKTTLDEFLVPAVYGAKWILVGDPYQLFPYSDEEDAASAISKEIEGEIADNPQIRDVVEKLIQLAQEEQMLRLEGSPRHGALVDELRQKMADMQALSPVCLEAIQTTLSVKLCSVLEQLIGGNEGIPSPLFKALISLPSEATKNRLVRLDYQHRMDAAIADFPSRAIYGGRSMLTNLKEPRAKFHIEERVVKREVRKTAPFDMSDPQGIKRISPTEAVLAMAEIAMISKWVQDVRPGKPPSVYVVAFYRNQRELLERAFRRMKALDGSIPLDVLFHTVDTCQGHEADIVILSFGRDSEGQRSSFMRSFNRVNVALTRAKSHLILTRLPPGNGSGDIVDRLHEELDAGRMVEGNHDVSPKDRCVIAVQEALKEMRAR